MIHSVFTRPISVSLEPDSFEYTLEDESELQATATVTITVERINDPPTAEANGPYACQQGDVITLSGTGSSDPDGNIASYDWGLWRFGRDSPIILATLLAVSP